MSENISKCNFIPDDYYYNRFGNYLKQRFGEKVHKISIDAGFDCPNRESGREMTGCAWCENSSFNPNPREAGRSVAEQAKLGVKLLKKRLGIRLFIAYFQAYSNTYASCEKLYELYKQALNTEGVIGLAIGTRPDCIDNEKLAMIAELSKETDFLQIEYGLQTANNQTLAKMNRGHTVEDYLNAMKTTGEHGIETCTHMITGLPDENEKDALKTLQTIIDCQSNGLKIHNLHIVKGSRLGKEYLTKPFHLPTEEEHIRLVCDLLEKTPLNINIQRLWGASATKEKHIAPDWCLDHNHVRFAIEKEFKKRGTRQGSCL